MNYKKANIMLWLTTTVWGLGFVATRIALVEGITVLEFIAIRFGIGAILINTIFFKQFKNITKYEFKAGSAIGAFVLLGFIAQTFGLLHVTPSVGGFVTATYVIIVPFLDRFLYKKKIDIYDGAAAALMLVGLGFITIADDFRVNIFVLPVLACAFFYALQTSYTGVAVQKNDAVRLSIIMFNFVFISATIMAVGQNIATGHTTIVTARAVYWLLFCGIFGTFIAFLFQNIAQKYVNATRAAIVLSMESVFALIFSIILYGEIVTFRILIGGGIILSAIMLCQTKFDFLKRRFYEQK